MTREEFTAQVSRVQGAFRRFLTALCCGDSSVADDIAQESLIKAYLSSEGLKSEGSFDSWLFRIGYNTFLNHRRGGRIFAEYSEAVTSDTGDSADGGFEYQALYAALGQLPEMERTSTLLYYMEGYSTKEIAEIEGTTQDAVRQHLSRGRARLRSLLKD